MKILITGGAGFIGSAVAREIIQSSEDSVVILDKLTYAGNLRNLDNITHSKDFGLNRRIYAVLTALGLYCKNIGQIE